MTKLPDHLVIQDSQCRRIELRANVEGKIIDIVQGLFIAVTLSPVQMRQVAFWLRAKARLMEKKRKKGESK